MRPCQPIYISDIIGDIPAQMGLGGFLCFRTKTLQADERARWCENPPKMEVESQAGGQYLNQQTGIMRYERF